VYVHKIWRWFGSVKRKRLKELCSMNVSLNMWRVGGHRQRPVNHGCEVINDGTYTHKHTHTHMSSQAKSLNTSEREKKKKRERGREREREKEKEKERNTTHARTKTHTYPHTRKSTRACKACARAHTHHP
jgi:hypothetical protein